MAADDGRLRNRGAARAELGIWNQSLAKNSDWLARM